MPQLLLLNFINVFSYLFLFFLYFMQAILLSFLVELSADLFLATLLPQAHEILLLSFIPVMIYHNAETDKSKILMDNKGKSAIYMWIHKESSKRYIGSAVDLYTRLNNYFSINFLERNKTIYIYNALLHHNYSAFSLSILKYIDITNLSSEEARKKILEREQYYLDLIFSEDEPNTYNILKIAGSLLGYKHTKESIAKFSGENHPLFGATGENHPRGFLGKIHTTETLTKISTSLGTTIYVYNSQGLLVYTFSSSRKAAKFFNCSDPTIMKYARNGEIFKGLWILSTSPQSEE
jgi:group I intron endonuclease